MNNRFGYLAQFTAMAEQQGGQPKNDSVVISKEAWDFLCGAGPLEGRHFGDTHPTRPGLYWWRSAILEQQRGEG